jgi:hypothetical protein
MANDLKMQDELSSSECSLISEWYKRGRLPSNIQNYPSRILLQTLFVKLKRAVNVHCGDDLCSRQTVLANVEALPTKLSRNLPKYAAEEAYKNVEGGSPLSSEEVLLDHQIRKHQESN